MRALALLSAFALSLFGCGDDAGPADVGAGDAGPGGDAGTDAGVDAGGPACPGAENPRGWISDTDVATGVGIVRGQLLPEALGPERVTRFRGIPFAESTAGENRFRPPVPRRCLVERADEVFAADLWPAICRQTDPDDGPVGSEDCLGLNVWAPTRSSAGERRPVIVWLHGGGMWYGNAQTDAVPGPQVASYGMVAVSLHSRVGPLGYVAHPVFEDESPTGEASGNYGLMDVIEGLRWVRDEIDAFGGDPDNVTVIGVSGGGDRVYYLMASPQAAGLFHRAAPHAGSTWIVADPRRIERSARTMATQVGCGDLPDGPALKACLRAAPVEAFDDFPYLSEEGYFYANVDGYMLTDTLEQVFASGDYNHVPVLSLSDAEDRGRSVPENVAEIVGDADRSGVVGDEGDWRAFITASYGSYAGDIIAAYPFSAFEDSHLARVHGTFFAAAQAMETDWLFNCAHRRLADVLADHQTEPVRFALFNDCPDDGTLPSTCTNGATHGMDLLLIFLVNAHNDAEGRLAGRMAAYWMLFAATGDPNGAAGFTPWPTYDRTRRDVMVFDSDRPGVDDHSFEAGTYERVLSSPLPSRCDLWDRIWDERGMVAAHYHDLDGDGVIDRVDPD